MTSVEQARAQAALRELERLGLNVKPVWRELTDRVETYERGTPSEVDMRYKVPTTVPTIREHFDGRLPEVLRPEVMWTGYSYTLSPGQRRWFRDYTGLTPAMTVTVQWVETWPGTEHPRAFKVVSDVHVDPRVRKHLLTEWVVREPGAFFQRSAEFDAEEAVAKQLSLVVGPTNVWTAKHRWALEDLSGVRFDRKYGAEDVDIVTVSQESITFSDPTGRVATVSRSEFLGTVADYERMHAEGVDVSKTRKGATTSVSVKPTVRSIEELMKELEKELSL